MKGKKVIPGLAAGSLVTILCWVLSYFLKVPVPGEVGAAAGMLLTIIISLALPDNVEADE